MPPFRTPSTPARRRALLAAAALTVTTLSLFGLPGAAAAQATAPRPAGGFAGAYALAVDTTLLGGALPLVVDALAPTSRSCPRPQEAARASVLAAGDPQIVRAAVLNSGSEVSCGARPRADAQSSVLDVDALGVAGPLALHADVITATSSSSCAAVPSGSVRVVNLTLGGTKIIPDGLVAPNTVVASPLLAPLGLTIIVNEQHPAAGGRGFIVNGVHILASNEQAVLPVGGTLVRGDVIISHAVTGIACRSGEQVDAPAAPNTGLELVSRTSTTTARPGDRITYELTLRNHSALPCQVLWFINHLSPGLRLRSTTGPLGSMATSPAPVRGDGGEDVVLHPTGVVIPAGAAVVQTITADVIAGAVAGTHDNWMELFGAPTGNFASGPLAPVEVLTADISTLPAAGPDAVAPNGAGQPTNGQPTNAQADNLQTASASRRPMLPMTGLSSLAAFGALLLVGAGAGLRRFARH